MIGSEEIIFASCNYWAILVNTTVYYCIIIAPHCPYTKVSAIMNIDVQPDNKSYGKHAHK